MISPETDSLVTLESSVDTGASSSSRAAEKRFAPSSEELPVKKIKTKQISQSLILKYLGFGKDVIAAAQKTGAIAS